MLSKLFLLHIWIIFLVLFSVPLKAQTQQTFTGWSAAFFTYKINPKFSIHFDGQARSTDQLKEIQSFIIRPGLNYHIKNNMIATVGYAYIGNQRNISAINGWVSEHRIWEQFIINQKFTVLNRPSTLQHRFRLEQRFMGQPTVEQNELVTDRYDFAQRLRYFTRAIVPICETTSFTDGAFIALQNEIFAHIQNSPNSKIFDQNRAYLALGWRINPKFDVEAGYLNQYTLGKNNKTVNNIMQLAAYLRL